MKIIRQQKEDCRIFCSGTDNTMQMRFIAAKNGAVPLVPREGGRSMFSACRLIAKYVFTPKNGPVPLDPEQPQAEVRR
jgi:hypothetical protein